MKYYLHLLLVAWVMTACTTDSLEEPRPTLTIDCTEERSVCDLAKANNSFGFQALQQLHTTHSDENIVLSPTSIATALSMTLNGTAGNTQAELQNTLQLRDWDLPTINAAYKTLLEHVPSFDEEVQFSIANAIWYDQAFDVKKDFIATNQEYFQSEIAALNFTNPEAVGAINDWINGKTEGLIPTIIEKIPPEMVMYLTNAVYFKGNWVHPFDPELTQEQLFYTETGAEEPIQMMIHPNIVLPYYESENFKMVELPYGDSIFTMDVLLPHRDVSVDDLIQDLTIANWETWTDKLAPFSFIFAMPKLKLSYEETLNQTLQQLGIQDAFNSARADFSKINDKAQLFISEVKHKTFIEVDEEGTAAAAVTSVGVGVTSVPPSVILDRPFLFVIRENKTNNILFLGKVMNPNEE